jgi:hypothetical protein
MIESSTRKDAGLDVERVESLDISLYGAIYSQSNDGDKRSLLAVQRATARKFGAYNYLEIGSHLWGTIQPHLVDGRCNNICSIDPRPAIISDDRKPGAFVKYENNSSARMLNLLVSIGRGDVSKIECIERSSPDLDPLSAIHAPHFAFIDGEHTCSAVMAYCPAAPYSSTIFILFIRLCRQSARNCGQPERLILPSSMKTAYGGYSLIRILSFRMTTLPYYSKEIGSTSRAFWQAGAKRNSWRDAKMRETWHCAFAQRVSGAWFPVEYGLGNNHFETSSDGDGWNSCSAAIIMISRDCAG